MNRIRAVILDRDGVLNRNRHTGVISVSQWEWIPGALTACRALSEAGFALGMATNQSVIGDGQLTEAGLREIHEHMTASLAEHGVPPLVIEHCPHVPEDSCACRKPNPGLLEQVLIRLGVRPEQALLVGDHITDIQAAHAAGCWSIHVRTGRGLSPDCTPPHYLGSAVDLLEVVDWIKQFNGDRIEGMQDANRSQCPREDDVGYRRSWANWFDPGKKSS